MADIMKRRVSREENTEAADNVPAPKKMGRKKPIKGKSAYAGSPPNYSCSKPGERGSGGRKFRCYGDYQPFITPL